MQDGAKKLQILRGERDETLLESARFGIVKQSMPLRIVFARITFLDRTHNGIGKSLAYPYHSVRQANPAIRHRTKPQSPSVPFADPDVKNELARFTTHTRKTRLPNIR